MMSDVADGSKRAQAAHRAAYSTSLVWHIGSFVILNAFLWWLDLTVGPSDVSWAHWITVVWGVALAFHALAWFIDGRALERRLTDRYLESNDHATD